MSSHSQPILAIDFGTSNSLVGAFVNNQKIEALPIDPFASDQTLMRTLLYFPHADQCFYGAEALKQYITEDMEGRLFRSFKSHLPNQSYLGTIVDNRILTLENMVGTFLLELKKRAEKILETKVTKAVIGRPARYSMDPVADEIALVRMKKAAAFAGFTEVEFIPEPLAAAFDFRKKINSEKLILIGDFGGGTSDFTVIRLHPDQFSKKDVLSIEGCPLAGDALDSLFMSHKLNRNFGAGAAYRMPFSTNVLKMPNAITQRLNHPAHIVHLKEKDTYEFIKEVRKCALLDSDKEAIDRLFLMIEDQQIFSFFEKIELAKKNLSSEATYNFCFDYPGLEIKEIFSRAQFIEWALETKNKIFKSLDDCLVSAGVSYQDIDLVCLTGGTAQVPFIRNEFEKLFGKDRLQAQSQFHSVLSGLIESAAFWSAGII
ncbi:MAG: Hsp70 family protein [Pseudobdellovibrio sp.]